VWPAVRALFLSFVIVGLAAPFVAWGASIPWYESTFVRWALETDETPRVEHYVLSPDGRPSVRFSRSTADGIDPILEVPGWPNRRVVQPGIPLGAFLAFATVLAIAGLAGLALQARIGRRSRAFAVGAFALAVLVSTWIGAGPDLVTRMTAFALFVLFGGTAIALAWLAQRLLARRA